MKIKKYWIGEREKHRRSNHYAKNALKIPCIVNLKKEKRVNVIEKINGFSK